MVFRCELPVWHVLLNLRSMIWSTRNLGTRHFFPGRVPILETDTWIPQSFTNITSQRAPYICIILSQSNRVKCTWTRRLHHMYHVNTVALQVLWTQTYTYDTNIITFSSQLKDVCPNRIPLFQLATLHRYEMPMKAKKDMSIFWLKDPSICFPPPENCESEGSDALPGRQSKKITYAEA